MNIASHLHASTTPLIKGPSSYLNGLGKVERDNQDGKVKSSNENMKQL